MKGEGKYRGLFYMGILAILVLLLSAGIPALAQEKKASESGSSSGSVQQSQQAAQQKDLQSEQTQARQQTQSDQEQKMQKDMRSDRYQQPEQKSEQKTGEMARQQDGQPARMSQYKPIVGREVRSTRGDDIGEVDNIVVNDDGSQIQAVVALGGFLGIGQKKVLVSLDELQFEPASDVVVYRGTEKDLERLAEYEEPEGRRFAERPYSPMERRGYYGAYDERGAYREGDRFGYRYPAQEDRYGRGYYEGRENRFGDERGRYEDRFREDERYGRGYDRDDSRFYRDERSDRGYMMRERRPMMGGRMRYDDDSRNYEGRFEGREDGRYFAPMDDRYDRRYDERYGRQ
ncbi:MAG: hypothetical protein C4530_19540 [Desulfobacteraceae bacterium]|nr:MAG: hypothetical protein C4530_19540 [Desulfobacteraceae bacterium]